MVSRAFKSNAAWVALGIGVALVIAAVVYAVLKVDLSSLKAAKPWHVLVLLVAVMFNLVLTSGLWWAMTLSFDAKPTVGFKKMFSLVCASGLLNYLPLRPGLLGRAAYLKMRHKLPIKQSVAIIITMVGLSALVLGGATVIIRLDAPEDLRNGIAGISIFVGLIVIPLAARGILGRKLIHAWAWVPLRLADLAVTSARMWVAFRVVGYEIDWVESILVAAGGMIVALSGITPNGLGLREWAIAGLSSASVGLAVAAAVVDRAIETVVVAVSGLLALKSVGDLREVDGEGVDDESSASLIDGKGSGESLKE